MRIITAVAIFAWLASVPVLAGDSPAPTEALFQAVRAADSAAVRKLLKAGVDIHSRDELGNTALIAAGLTGDVALLELLVEAGADVNAANAAGATPLMRAATFENAARLLVERGADVSARSRLGNTPLILAARKFGNSRTVKRLLDKGAEVSAANEFGATALMAAVAALDIDSVRLLLDRGADPNAGPKMSSNGFIWGGGRSALMWAAYGGDEALLKLLLERGANVNDSSLAGGALAQAAWNGHAGAARLLLDSGAQVDQRDRIANFTPLHWAASSERSSPALVELLLARGADPNAEGGQPVDNFLGATQTPLSLARKRGDTPIVRVLIKAGAKEMPESGPPGRRTAAHASAGDSGSKTAAEAVQRALIPLTRTAEESVRMFQRHASRQDCISCHQQQLPLVALSLAGSRRFAIDRQAVGHQLDLLKRFNSSVSVTRPDEQHTALEVALQATFHPEPTIGGGYLAMAFVLEHEPASTITDALCHQLVTMQHSDGHWSRNLPRPPIQASDIAATAQAIYVIKSFGIRARQREMVSSLQRARDWLARSEPETNEERAHHLLGLAWAGEKPAALTQPAKELLARQRADGGWGQLAGLDSDAYATAQSLYALLEAARTPPDDPAVLRGIDFLIRTQGADGTWHVRRRAHPFQPPMDSGFPHGADGWISSAGTSWAVMALVLSLDPSKEPPALAAIAKTAAPAVVAATVADQTGTPVDFARDIQPLFERSCVACHSGQRPRGGLRMTDRESVLNGGNRGEPAIVPGKPDASPLLRLVQDQVDDLEMPPVSKRGKFPALTRAEIAKLTAWIAAGATWPEGVTLQPPGK